MKRIATGLAIALVLVAPAHASRAPTTTEKAKIEFAVRYFPPLGRQNTIAFKTIRVSTVDGRYALVRAAVHDASGDLVGNDAFLVQRTNLWNVIWVGRGSKTSPLACDAAPEKVRLDLLGTTACQRHH